MLNISSNYDGAVYLTSAPGLMLPEETQHPQENAMYTLKPGQLAIIATQSYVQIQAITDQLIISVDVLPQLLLVEVMQKFCDGHNYVQSLEEILHSLSLNENQYSEQQWYRTVKRTVVGAAAEMAQTLTEYEGDKFNTGICTVCSRHYYLFAIYCVKCDRFYCIWCQYFREHEHTMYFVSNFLLGNSNELPRHSFGK